MILAFDIGGTYTKYALMKEDGGIEEQGKVPSDARSRDCFVHSLSQVYERYQEQAGGVAVSFPGIIDTYTGECGVAGSYLFLNNTNLYDLLRPVFKVPVYAQHDGKCAALGEVWKGCLKDIDDAIVLAYGTGIAGALIKDHKLYVGAGTAAGEMSHIIIEPDYENKKLKRLYEEAGTCALVTEAARRKGISAESYSGEQLFEDVKAGDPKAEAALERFCKVNAVWLTNMQVIYAPQVIAVGGGISRQPSLLPRLRNAIDEIETWTDVPLYKPKLVSCMLHNEANLVGALYNYLTVHRQVSKKDW